MVNQVKPDERAVMTYVSCYYHAFSSSQQAETAAKRILKALNVNQGNEKSIENYENLASDLLDWINKKIPDLTDRTAGSLADMQDKLNDFRNYRGIEKPPKVDDKATLENLYNTLQTKLRLSNRPIYMPQDGILVSNIDKAWKDLEQAEKDFQDWILNQLRKLERLDHLAMKFKHKCDIHQAWSAGQDEYLKADDIDGAQLATLLAARKRHEAFESDLAAQQDRVEQIVAIAQELNTLGYSKVDEVNARCKVICDGWDTLGDLTLARNQKLNDAIEKAERLDNLWLEYAKKASPFNNWMDGAKEDLMDLFSVHTIEEVQDLKDAQEKFKANMPAAQEEYQSILELQRYIDSMSNNVKNPYTNTKAADLTAKWEEILELIPKRDKMLSDETTLQQNNERLRVQFAQKANTIGQWIEQRSRKMVDITVNGAGTLEDQLQELKLLSSEIESFKEHILEINNINNVVQEAMIFENTHTPFTMEVLRIRFEQLLTGCTRNINEVENQIMMRDSFGITEEQMKELRASFNHFDKSGNGQLEYKEFKQCLVSLGQSLDVDDSSEREFKQYVAMVDPNNTGYVSFQAFLDFMTREMADIDTADQVMESFRILAGDKHYITADELRRELPGEQAEYCIQRMSPYTGTDGVEGALDYKSFSTALYGESDL